MKIDENTSILYWAICNEVDSPGVYNKVSDFVLSANDIGIKAKSSIQNNGLYSSYILSLLNLLFSKENIIILRYNNLACLILLIFTLALRIIGKKVVYDVPTPIIFHIKYTLSKNKSVKDYFEIISSVLLGPLPFIAANLVIQYSNESAYFNPKCLTNCLLIGNGIRVTNFNKDNDVVKNITVIRLLAVGNIAIWHGWDRVLKAFSILLYKYNRKNISLDIIGEGPEKNQLILLSKELKLTDIVKFHGNMVGSDLIELYKTSNLCVGSFGWDRLGLTIASPLKYREYLSNGLPFIYATSDPDIDLNCNVAFKLPPNEEEIAEFINLIEITNLPSRLDCQKYCYENMSFSKKIPLIIDKIR